LKKSPPNDLFIAAKYDESKCTMEQLIQAFDDQINAKQDASAGDYQPPTLSSAVEHLKGANLCADLDSRPVCRTRGGRRIG